jgi:hypothetical protein
MRATHALLAVAVLLVCFLASEAAATLTAVGGEATRCDIISSSSACSATSSCVWNYAIDVCTANCRMREANYTACLSNPSCTWGYNDTRGADQCFLRCEFNKEQACRDFSGLNNCFWNGTQCSFSCDVPLNECLVFSDCQLSAGGDACVPSCRSHASRMSCVDRSGCRWNPESMTCYQFNAPPTAQPPATPAPAPQCSERTCANPEDCGPGCGGCGDNYHCYPSPPPQPPATPQPPAPPGTCAVTICNSPADCPLGCAGCGDNYYCIESATPAPITPDDCSSIPCASPSGCPATCSGCSGDYHCLP